MNDGLTPQQRAQVTHLVDQTLAQLREANADKPEWFVSSVDLYHLVTFAAIGVNCVVASAAIPAEAAEVAREQAAQMIRMLSRDLGPGFAMLTSVTSELLHSKYANCGAFATHREGGGA